MRQLSMGVSGDFEAAIAEGATIVRVGQAVFGRRALTDEHFWATGIAFADKDGAERRLPLGRRVLAGFGEAGRPKRNSDCRDVAQWTLMQVSPSAHSHRDTRSSTIRASA